MQKKKNIYHFARAKFSELVFFNPYSLFILPLPNWYLLTYYNLHRPQSQILVKKKKKKHQNHALIPLLIPEKMEVP
jgi:hypothetical protein